MSLRVLQQGVSALPVDLGRQGYQHLGITIGGPMDLHAFLWANHLVSNPLHCAQLEICHGHFHAEFNAPCAIALTGADMQAKINQQPCPRWRTVALKQGDKLTLSGAQEGLYAYLSIAGGFKITPQLGSVCAVKRDGLGGLNQDGSGLKNGDVLPFAANANANANANTNANAAPPNSLPLKRTPPAYVPIYDDCPRLGIIECYQHALFNPAQQRQVYQQTFTVSAKFNRQGITLQGEPIAYSGGALLSEGIAYGAMQVPPDGQPIVLLRDRQSIGGYPKFGCVSTLDAGRLAQRRPGAAVQFKAVTLQESQQQLQQLLSFFNRATANNR